MMNQSYYYLFAYDYNYITRFITNNNSITISTDKSKGIYDYKGGHSI